MKIIISGNTLCMTGSVQDIRRYLGSLAAQGGTLEDYIRQCLK